MFQNLETKNQNRILIYNISIFYHLQGFVYFLKRVMFGGCDENVFGL